MENIIKYVCKFRWILIAFSLLFLTLFFNIFIDLDQGEEPFQSDVIIVAESNNNNRAHKGVELLLNGYSISDQLVVSPATELNLPYYFDAGAEKEQLILEKEATSTWTNATNTIEIIEENNWDSAIVVTTDYHTRRTRLAFERVSRGKDMDFTYVSSYQRVNGQPTSYLDHSAGRRSGLSETFKYFGYLLGLYHVIDM